MPEGESPDLNGATPPCLGGNNGSDDFACETFALNERSVRTFVEALQPPDDPEEITIPAGERFAGLRATEFRYRVRSESLTPLDEGEANPRSEARLDYIFRSRLVPMFQFAAFYNKDLEIHPGAEMNLNGPIHVNGDLYLSAGDLNINGAITVSEAASLNSSSDGGNLFTFRKRDEAWAGSANVRTEGGGSAALPNIASPDALGETYIDNKDLDIEVGLDTITVPGANDPDAEVDYSMERGGFYWGRANLRVVLDLNENPPHVEVWTPGDDGFNSTYDGGLVEDLDTSNGGTCPASALNQSNPAYHDVNNDGSHSPVKQTFGNRAIEWSRGAFYDHREAGHGSTDGRIDMLEVDLQALLACIQMILTTRHGDFGLHHRLRGRKRWLGSLLHRTRPTMSVPTPTACEFATVKSMKPIPYSAPGAPDVAGLTIVTDQALYVQGSYNNDRGNPGDNRLGFGAASNPDQDRIPASFLADLFNVLSEAWDGVGQDNSKQDDRNRSDGFGDNVRDADGDDDLENATQTWINAAVLAGTDSTGGQEGTAGQGGGGKQTKK
ncbi:MAG: hypothetical protein U5L04_11015 [Trueperaceae bacterium]|nr:hypothetical protein [Trueperaceae bacterium]